MRSLELLSPALNSETAIQAILHGADAVYMGATSHGARKAASNSIDQIAKVVDFAHQYRSKVYTTVNTIIYDGEIKKVEELCRILYHIGVDALIIQDMGMLRMNLPPIALHASTQCDIRTPEKAKFLEEVGFSQLVLARELTLSEIKDISSSVNIPIECFVHGALCVSYSGRCHASLALTGRSANRGECAQICRYPFTLKDSSGRTLAKDKYLLSLKDFNASYNLTQLIEAGVSSFKIEGRLKDLGYVKNITAYYNNQLIEIIRNRKENLRRTSFGKVDLKFNPNPYKSFNRGFTDYFQTQRQPMKIISMYTPKSQGEKIKDYKQLNNGDGISFYDGEGNFTGVNINKVENGKLITARKIDIPENADIYRTSDVKWEKMIKGETATRKIRLKIHIDETGISAQDERGVSVRIPLEIQQEFSDKETDYRKVFEKLGNTCFKLEEYHSELSANLFIPLSLLTQKRRELIDLLQTANKTTYKFDYRREEDFCVKYPYEKLDYRDNVSNRLAEKFYLEHGVKKIERAAETTNEIKKDGKVLMTTRHCILREMRVCRKQKKDSKLVYPLYLHHSKGKFRLNFDCNKCEMQVISVENN